ncbi:uncharacterized protein LOC114977804 isoform X2 [Acropora millepora]|uniref:uncharacterized protein LOC114977804 isoform X2 n=1 Tax=Acropora millepora TaxID=45264 RepID=UPI001CF26F9C|nr:uncharacterized protein LOC114977804 isoform X2 [Acropora millepora]
MRRSPGVSDSKDKSVKDSTAAQTSTEGGAHISSGVGSLEAPGINYAEIAQVTKTKTYCGSQKDWNCKKSFTIWLGRV